MHSTLWAFPPFGVPEEGGVPCIIPPIDLQKIFENQGKKFLKTKEKIFEIGGNLFILLGMVTRIYIIGHTDWDI